MEDNINITTIIGLLFLLVAFWYLKPAKHPLFAAENLTGRVRYVVDGDSLYMTSHRPQVRLWGVNTPEIGERGYDAATDYLERIAKGQQITCQIMHRDRYGRTVGRCYLAGGRDIGRMMIESGHAREMLGFSKGYYSRRN